MGITIVPSFARAQVLRYAHMERGGTGTNWGNLILSKDHHDDASREALLEKVIFKLPYSTVKPLSFRQIPWKKNVEVYVVGTESMDLLKDMERLAPGFIDHFGPVIVEPTCQTQ